MRIKPFIIILYIVAGLVITAITSFVTYIVIGVPIKQPMVIKMILTVLAMLPVIGLISYLVGHYLSKNFKFIHSRLEQITQEDYTQQKSLSSIKDISEINNMSNQLAFKIDNLVDGLKEKNSNLSVLLASLAHDIKTPLAIINGHIDEIKDGYVTNEKLPETLVHIKNEIKYLDELTVDVLSFLSSMSNGKPKDIIKLKSFLDREVLNIIPVKKGIVVKNIVDESLVLEFNKMDLKKICINLLTNAIKYTKSGYVGIYSKDREIFFVNSGTEIKDEYKDKIFQPFFTISKSKSRQNRGFGLGLSIVSNLSKNNKYRCYLKISDNTKTIFALSPIE